jgi:hypothetical protein
LGSGNGMKWAVNIQSAYLAKVLNSDQTRKVARCRQTLTFQTFVKPFASCKTGHSFSRYGDAALLVTAAKRLLVLKFGKYRDGHFAKLGPLRLALVVRS